jgi:hypothetical protein
MVIDKQKRKDAPMKSCLASLLHPESRHHESNMERMYLFSTVSWLWNPGFDDYFTDPGYPGAAPQRYEVS